MRQAARISTAKKGGGEITFACFYSLNIYIIRRLILHINNLTKTAIFSFFFLIILRSNICSIEWKKETMCVDRPMAYIGLTAMVKWLSHWHIGQRLGSVPFLYNPSVMGLFFFLPNPESQPCKLRKNPGHWHAATLLTSRVMCMWF